MEDSSPQETYSINFDNITLTNDYLTIPSVLDIEGWSVENWNEWEHYLPDLYTLREMCAIYPALEKAFENFKTVYGLVKDDYASKTKNEDQ